MDQHQELVSKTNSLVEQGITEDRLFQMNDVHWHERTCLLVRTIGLCMNPFGCRQPCIAFFSSDAKFTTWFTGLIDWTQQDIILDSRLPLDL